MPPRPRLVPVVLVTVLAFAPAAMAAQEAAVAASVIKADDAASHVGEEVTVEMVVRAARALADKDVCFLNSRRDHRDTDTFTVVIFKVGLDRFREKGVDNPALHFLDRTIRVRGKVVSHKERPEIVVEDPDQIELVEAAAAKAADDDDD
jgi:DNA/RNA endonuclease YhcR with UshA esterase domain